MFDALALGDAMHQLLQPLFEHTGVVKVFHGEVDHVASPAFSYGLLAYNIFNIADISVFYGACEDGWYPGLHTLCENCLGLELETTPPQAIWGQRPLSPHMMRCAATEVAALVPLHHAMVTECKSEWRASCFDGGL